MTFQKTKNKRSNPEADVCRAWLKWLKLQYPRAYEYIIKIDNEGTTNRANAVSLGLHVGASDYFLAYPTLEHYGAWFEVKADNWKLTKSTRSHYERQIAFGEKMKAKSYAFYFCAGLDKLIDATKDYLNVNQKS